MSLVTLRTLIDEARWPTVKRVNLSFVPSKAFEGANVFAVGSLAEHAEINVHGGAKDHRVLNPPRGKDYH